MLASSRNVQVILASTAGVICYLLSGGVLRAASQCGPFLFLARLVLRLSPYHMISYHGVEEARQCEEPATWEESDGLV